MKALVYIAPKQLELRDVCAPKPANNEVLVRVACSGICGSDMHAYLGHDERRLAPLILGHEVAGTIASGSSSGKRVTVNPLVTCGLCCACKEGRDNLCPDRQIISMQPREGGFAEYITIPKRNLVGVPDHVSFSKAALAEPLACGWHSVKLAIKAFGSEIKDCQTLVIGGGAIGVGAALSLKAQGIENIHIVEPNKQRGAFLQDKCALDVIFDGNAVIASNYDIVIDAVGIPASRANACIAIKPGGIIAHIGLGSSKGGLDIRRMTLQEITFIGTYTYTSEDFKATAQAIFDERLGPLNWVDIRNLSEGAGAFSDLSSGLVAAPKILLKPD